MSNQLLNTIRPVYNRCLRPFLPKKSIPITNIPGDIHAEARLLDLSRSIEIKPAAVELIREYIGDGDHVVEVATGRGYYSSVCLVEGATVTGFEPQAKRIECARENHSNIGLADRIEIHHAVIGRPKIELEGADGAEHMEPSELPSGDVLLLDCEGSEREILANIESAYDRILVEIHPSYGAEYEDIKALLDASGYRIIESVSFGKPKRGQQFVVATRQDSQKGGFREVDVR